MALGKLALQLQTDGATLLRQQQAEFELNLEQHTSRAAILVAKPAPIEESPPPAPSAPSDEVQVARSTPAVGQTRSSGFNLCSLA